MNVTTALKASSEHGGPVVLGAGITMLTVAVLMGGPGHPSAAAPAPTATTTVTAPPVTVRPAPAGTTTVSAPADHTSVLAAGQPLSATGGRGEPGVSQPPSRPEPSPQPTAVPRCGVGLSALALHACLSLGGSR
jgi:hypothetical protein